ncbi:MAG: hypothetical protein WA981_05780 [Glaciecola sp.]
MLRKTLISLSLFSMFIGASHAALIDINGGFYSKIESKNVTVNDVEIENEFNQSYFDYMPDTISHRLTFDPTRDENVNARTNNNTYEDAFNKGASNTTFLVPEIDTPNTVFTSQILGLVDFDDYARISTEVFLTASNQANTDLTSGDSSYYNSLIFTYAVFGGNQETVNGVFTQSDFSYSSTYSLNLDFPMTESDLLATDANSVLDTILGHAGKYVTVQESISLNAFTSQANGDYEAISQSLGYLGDGILSVVQVEVSTPATLGMVSLFAGLMLRRKIKL